MAIKAAACVTTTPGSEAARAASEFGGARARDVPCLLVGSGIDIEPNSMQAAIPGEAAASGLGSKDAGRQWDEIEGNPIIPAIVKAQRTP